MAVSSTFQRFVEDRTKLICLVIVAVVLLFVLFDLLSWLRDYNSPEQREERCMEQVSVEYQRSHPSLPGLPSGIAIAECDQKLGIPQ
jgi:hypothetical protein